MTFDPHALTLPSFWFSPNPLPPSPTTTVVLAGLFAAMALASIAVRVVRRRTRDKLRRALLARIAAMLAAMGILALLFFFFHYEQVSFLGARFWFLLWGAGLIVWIVFLVRFARVHVPRMRAKNQADRMRAKYLPRGA